MMTPFFILMCSYVAGAMTSSVPGLRVDGMTRARFFLVTQLTLLSAVALSFVSYFVPESAGRVLPMLSAGVTVFLIGGVFGAAVLGRCRDSGFGLKWYLMTIMSPILAVILYFRAGTTRRSGRPLWSHLSTGSLLGAGLIALSISGSVANHVFTLEIVQQAAAAVSGEGGTARARGSDLVLTTSPFEGAEPENPEWRQAEILKICRDREAVVLMGLGVRIVFIIDDPRSGPVQFFADKEVCKAALAGRNMGI